MADENNSEPNEQNGGAGSAGGAGADDAQAADSSQAAASAAADAAKGLTPGQRLALKRSKKAQQKQELKAELKRQEEQQASQEQEEAERILGVGASPSLPADAVQETASHFAGYVQEKRGFIVGALVGVVALGLAIIWGKNLLTSGSAEQAGLLANAVEIANAPIDESNTEGKDADGKPVFRSAADRATKAAQAFASAVKNGDDSQAADWAKLGQASVLVSVGRAAEADALFSETYKRRKDHGAIAPRALEGHAIALEAQDKQQEALKQLEELKKLENGAHKDLAEYHIARIKLAQGQRDEAKNLLKGLYDRLSARTDGSPKSRYLKSEVEMRLSELDSSLVPAGGGEGQQLSPEEIQRIIQQLQQQQKGSGGE